MTGVTALINAVWAEPWVNKSPPKNLEFYPAFQGNILKKKKKISNVPNF